MNILFFIHYCLKPFKMFSLSTGILILKFSHHTLHKYRKFQLYLLMRIFKLINPAIVRKTTHTVAGLNKVESVSFTFSSVKTTYDLLISFIKISVISQLSVKPCKPRIGYNNNNLLNKEMKYFLKNVYFILLLRKIFFFIFVCDILSYSYSCLYFVPVTVYVFLQ